MAELTKGLYGWVICAIACWISSSFGTIHNCFSIIIGPLVKEFDTSLVTMSAGWESIDALLFLMAPISAMIGKYLGHRTALTTSIILASTSIGCSALVKRDWQFILLYCILPGMCFSVMNICSVLTLITYFDEKFGIAMGLYKGSTRLGSVLHSMPINFLALHYGHEYNSVYMAILFLTCLSLMPLFYPNPVQKESRAKTNTYEPIQNEGFAIWTRWLFYVHLLFYRIGWAMIYGFIVELVEFQSIRKITTFERSLIIWTYTFVGGTYSILAPIIAYCLNIAPQLMVVIHLLLVSLIVMLLTTTTNFYCLLALVGVSGMCNVTTPTFAAPTSLALHPSKSPEFAMAMIYFWA